MTLLPLFAVRPGISSLPSTEIVALGLRFIRNSLILLTVNYTGKYGSVLLSLSPPDLSTPYIEPTNLFNLRTLWYIRRLLLSRSLEAYLTATPYIRPAVPPKLTSSWPSPASLTSTLTPSHSTSTQSRDKTSIDTVPSELKYRDLVIRLTTQLLKPTTARLNRAPLTLTNVYKLHRYLYSPEFFNNSTAISSSSALVALSVPDISLGFFTSYTDKTADDKPIPLANLAALTYARDISLDRLTYPFNLATRYTQIPVNSDRQPVLTPPSLYPVSSTILKPCAPTYRARKATRKETDPIALNLTTAEADVDKDIPDPDDVVTPSVSDELDSPDSVYTPPTDSVGTPYPPGVDAAVTKLSEL
ncbi:hypothetical protein AAEP93_004557 [Penicillium crustosum]